MSTKRKWTKEEEEILVQSIKDCPQNLEKVFREVSQKLGRTPAALHHKWHYELKKSSLCFMTVSPKKKINNGKIDRKDRTESTPKTLWQKIKNFFN